MTMTRFNIKQVLDSFGNYILPEKIVILRSRGKQGLLGQLDRCIKSQIDANNREFITHLKSFKPNLKPQSGKKKDISKQLIKQYHHEIDILRKKYL